MVLAAWPFSRLFANACVGDLLRTSRSRLEIRVTPVCPLLFPGMTSGFLRVSTHPRSEGERSVTGQLDLLE